MKNKVMLNEIQVEAPFAMPAINVPDFSQCRRMPITDYGAIQGDKDKTTIAIASAIAIIHKHVNNFEMNKDRG
ncbi:hypothetical protein [Cesiribacter sp. SM1]|uniref:hypothetical protein n=1 Tax=Cesiribacter sp. SM1 TaxID=2861196 RepID=UPI001CD3772B|nr:hypothetical protein [Cesiribacter sp. SM1]